MKFMFLIYHDENRLASLSQADNAKLWQDYAAFNAALEKHGAYQPGERLQPSNAARTVRVSGVEHDVLDGPYAETKEQFAGYMMIEVPTMEEALEWAARSPSARYGAIEVRPMHVEGKWK